MFWRTWRSPQPLQVACFPQAGLAFWRDGSLTIPTGQSTHASTLTSITCAAAQRSSLPCHFKTQSLNLLCPLLILRFLCYYIYTLSPESWGIDKSTPALKITCFITLTCASAAATPWWVSIRAPGAGWGSSVPLGPRQGCRCRVGMWPPILRKYRLGSPAQAWKCSICHSVLGIAQLGSCCLRRTLTKCFSWWPWGWLSWSECGAINTKAVLGVGCVVNPCMGRSLRSWTQ